MSQAVVRETEDAIYFLETSISSLSRAVQAVSQVTADKERFKEALDNEQCFTVVPQHDYAVKRSKLSEILEPQIASSYDDLTTFVTKLKKKKDILTNRCKLSQANFEETARQSGDSLQVLSQLEEYQRSLESLQELQQKREQLRAKLNSLKNT